MAAEPPRSGWFAVPTPVRELFKLFPLTTLPAEPLPARAPDRTRPQPQLYVFASDEDALNGRPSFNPACLKWQTFLRIAGVDVDLVPSNNHASPSGALPFLLPPPSSSASSSPPLTGDKIGRFARDNCSIDIPILSDSPSRAEAYSSLLTQNIRPAWLYTLYLLPANLPLLTTLYLPPSPILRLPLLHTLRTAASAEILKTTRRTLISPPQLLSDFVAALRALSSLLGDSEWFFGLPSPALFDAEVFAYTHLILDSQVMHWKDEALAKALLQFDNLVEHRERLYRRCWPGEQQKRQ